jgi:hypothetical protein
MKFVASIVTLLAVSAVEAQKLRSREHSEAHKVRTREQIDEKVARAKAGGHKAKAARMDDGPSMIVGGNTTSIGEFPYYGKPMSV